MKKLFLSMLISFSLSLQAQKHEIGGFLGATNLISDIGRTDYINPFPKEMSDGYSIPIAVGLLYRLNYNPQHTLRFSLGYYNEAYNDKVAIEDYRYQRGYQFRNSIIEAAAVFEYNFFPINSEQERAYSPYIFGGIGGFLSNTPVVNVYHQFQRDALGMPIKGGIPFDSSIEYETKKNIGFSLPIGLGFKYKFGWNWVVSAEVGFRPTFNDNLDLSSPKDGNYHFFVENDLLKFYAENDVISRNNEILENTKIGNPSTNDWYVFSGLTLTYAFGRPPCFCD
ncbi:DUF6089 family protein [Candidatus Ornithobacterium hominis]|uniref:type IX secretion system protein PorG n=1 Tax=Candidatus Ornithobacterium hominis TaxID=2497989 RepID=UPI0024BD1008|nr:DUF6089 family protein [Candidatus Ornithobacterium hominis]